MDYKRLDLATVEEIEQELARIASTDFRGIAAGRGHQAGLLLAEIHKRFDAAPGSQNILGFSWFTHWLTAFCEDRKVTMRLLWYYVHWGRFLLPRISEAQFEDLNSKKREILADLAEAGRLTAELLNDSFTISDDELKRKADPLLGRVVSWEERLVIRDHWAAIAALLQLGNLLDYKTYTAHPGIQFEGIKLGGIATLGDFPRFPTEEIERSAKRIDVIWVKFGEWPEFFFEVENADTTKVKVALQRMYQVLMVNAKFFVVGPESVHAQFLRAISESPYNRCRDKYLFQSYLELNKMFQAALRYRKAYNRFFVENVPESLASSADPRLGVCASKS